MNKKIKKTLIFSMLCSAISTTLLSTVSLAATTGNVSIEVVNDARVFAKFDSEIPAVVNYYTKKSEQSIIDFYRDKYGAPSSSERLKGRLTQKFSHNDKYIRVVISEQDNHRQVDVIVTQFNVR